MTLSIADAKAHSEKLNGLDDSVVESHLDYAILFLAGNYCVTHDDGESHINYDKAQLLLAEYSADDLLYVATTGKSVTEEYRKLATLEKRTRWAEGGSTSNADRFPKVHALLMSIGEVCGNDSSSSSYQLIRA